MEALDFYRCKALNNIPQRKLQLSIEAIDKSQDTLQNKNIKLTAINRYAESNIPIDYWSLKMERDFKGDSKLFNRYNDYINNIKLSYEVGTSVCFAGSHGVGKTLTITAILKRACNKGYSCLYSTISDIVAVLIQGNNDDKVTAKRELAMVDFLAIDEIDARFYNQSDNAKDLYGRAFEGVIRGRLQNRLPTLLATNSPNIKENFVSMFKDSLGSLLSKVEIFSVMPGNDFRKRENDK